MGTRQLAQWFGLLVDMLTVGFPLRRALTFTRLIMPKQAPVIDHVQEQLARGGDFASAVRPWLPADLYYQLQLAEHHGQLVAALTEMSSYLKLRDQEHQKLRALLQYPLLLVALLGGLAALLRVYVYPELSTWQIWQLPAWVAMIKQVLIGGSAAAVTFGLLRYLAWRRQPRLAQANYLCRLPLIGRLMKLYFSYYLTSNLAIMIQRGLALREICRLLEQYEPASLLYQLGVELQRQGTSGASLAAVIKRHPCLPDELTSFLGRGLTTERLGDELGVFARLQFTRLTRQTEGLIVMVQPVLFLLIALGILGMYLSLLLPIYQSMTVVN